MIRLLKQNKRLLPAITLILVCSLWSALSARAQEERSKQTALQSPSGRVNDFAGVLDAGVKERAENMLANLKERGGIEFSVALVKSTEGKDPYDYTTQLARQWKIGEMQSRDMSLLLLISTEDRKSLAQASRGLRIKMPEDLLGQMGSRMQTSLSKGNYNEALTNALQTFISQMAEKQGFNTNGMDQAPATAKAQAEQTTQTAQATQTTQATLPATDTLPKENTPPKESAAATAEPAPLPEPTPREAAAKQTKKEQRTLREVFTKDGGTKTTASPGDAEDKAELDALMQSPADALIKLPAAERIEKLAERIEKLKAFIANHPQSNLKPFATELLVSAHASLGDEKLQAGEIEAGLAEFAEAIAQSPEKMSDALFVKVVSQIPINLYMRGQRTASGDAAHLIEAKVKDDPKRLLALAGFYLRVEQADEAARLSELAIKLAPDMAAAHQALGAARHIALHLDDAATEYARALELDPKLAEARRSLADLRRAAGKPEDALALYREDLTADPSDKSARAGVVLSLLDLGKREEAEREMDEALKADANNLPLLVGASYWYAAHNEPARAQELATKAIGIEPRYTWAHIALARALLAERHPLDAERVLRFARTYGRFPTLDYELAGALAASGFYDEAAAELARSFTVKEGQIETRLAGHTLTHAASFIELLAPERRAGIFQPAAADTEANARVLKGLLEFATALGPADGKGARIDSALFAAAQEDFLSGEDPMRAFRQIYAANRLLQRGVELQKVQELSEAATGGVEAALDTPAATIAVMADELRDARAQAINSGQVLSIPEIPRNVLANILRGRIEDLIAWSLFNQDKASDALMHLKRAISVLPENSPWWRAAEWHMGATLEAIGNQQDALAAYIKGYDPAQPDPVRRAIIETLYRKVNGSLDGLNEKIGPAPSTSLNRE